MGEGDPRGRHQGVMTAPAATSSHVADHYARGGLTAAIRDGLTQMGRSERTVTADDLAQVDEFHIGGRTSTEALAHQLRLAPADRVLDIGCGLGGPARFIAARYGCHVTGVDLTPDYVEAGNVLCGWLALGHRVSLHHGDALSLPFADGTFTAAHMLHVGMNIADKVTLFAEAARVLRAGAQFGVFDVMRTADGELPYPLPWATTADANSVAKPADYHTALIAAGFEIMSARDRRTFALDYFKQQSARMASVDGPSPLGLHTLMGERRRDQVRNMSESIAAGRIAPFEIIARKQ